jgi:hypothetical protein
MKKLQKTKKIILTSALILAFSGTGLLLYQQNLAWSKAPAELEYLPTAGSTSGNTAETAESRPGLADFSNETVGAMPVSFAAAVGNWTIGMDNGNKVLVVDGRKWSRGKASAGLADQARALYGERYAEFLDNVQAYAYYPFAVNQSVENFTNGTIRMRFKAIAGRIDQGAGILFDLKSNGDYYTVRANPLENNLVLWRFKHGKRSSINWVRNVTTPTRKWHDIEVKIKGKQITASVNGKQYMKYSLPKAVSGRVGVWTKADSVVYFDDYTVTADK